MFIDRFWERMKGRFLPESAPSRERVLYDALERRALAPDQPFFSERFLR